MVIVVAARTLSMGSFGLFSLASALGGILTVATDFGLQLYAAREIAQTPARLGEILRPLLRLRLWLAAAGAAVTALVAGHLFPPFDALAFAVIVLGYLLNALIGFLNYVYRALSRSDLESTFNLIQRIATVALASVLLTAAPSLNALAVALALPPAGVLVYSLRTVRRFASAAPVTPDGFALTSGRFVREVLPIGAGVLLSVLYFRIDVFLLQRWQGIEAVAQYNAVFRLIEGLQLFPAAVLTVLLPAVFQHRDAEFVRRMSGGLAALGLLLAAVLYAAAPAIVTLAYGAAYAPAAPVLRVLALAVPLLSINYGLGHQVIGWGASRLFALVNGLALVANVAMNLVLIPRFGNAGAAWATVGTEVALTLAFGGVLRWMVRKGEGFAAPA